MLPIIIICIQCLYPLMYIILSSLSWCALLHCDVLRVGPYSFITYQHLKNLQVKLVR